MTVSYAQLAPLDKADGSATFSRNGYSVICAVNGPIEVQRRAELPEEAALEINIRPAVGVGSPKERHLESLVHSTLRHLVLVREHPRTLIQVSLQVLAVPEDEGLLPSSCHLSVLPALLQTSVLALVSACIPLAGILSTTILAIQRDTNTRILDPSPTELVSAASAHVFAFSSSPDNPLLLAESQGRFGIDDWEDVYRDARAGCCEPVVDGDDSKDAHGIQGFVQNTIVDHVRKSRAWQDDVDG